MIYTFPCAVPPEPTSNRRHSSRYLAFVVALLVFVALALPATAQLAGKGAVSGTVLDPTGASVPGATLTIVNDANGVSVTTTSTSAGDFNVSTLDAGVYSITVAATGFEKLTQKNVQVNALETVTFSPKLIIGAADQSVTVSTLPPQLETSNATLGATMENEMYSALPIEMNAGGNADQRRATDFAFLMPGVQGNNTTGNATTNTGIINGSGSKGAVSNVYVDGVAFVRAGGNGDPRYVWTAISVDAVDQFQVQTSGYSAIYEGQGIQNYTIKQGGSAYHGSIYEFLRNTALDTWGWTGASLVASGQHKPVEHTNEFGINLGGPLVPFGNWKNKVFFYGNYNGYRYSQETPTYITFPTLAQQGGDFSGVGYNIYDPNTETGANGTQNCTANSTNGPCRYQYGYVYGGTPGAAGNPIIGPAGTAGVNKIPAAEFAAAAKAMQSFIPALTNQNVQNNYLSLNKSGLVNWSTTDRIDYIMTPKDTLTLVAAIGRQASSNPVGQATVGRNIGPLPYNYSQAYAPKTAVAIIEETHTFTDHLVNQFKYGYARYNGPTFDSNESPAYAATKMGITGLPTGAAQNAFPITDFSGAIATPTNNSPTWWGGTTPNVTLAENYTIVDNVQWVKGKHTFTFGAQLAWMLYNVISATGNTTPLTINAAVTETAGLAASPAGKVTYAATPGTGQPYASFLIGQNDKLSLTQYLQQEFGARFRPISPYVQDNWKITSKLTADIGIRWDYFPSVREVHDAGSYFSPTLANPITGTNGGLEFTGHGAGTCNCDTPVQNWYKNFGPRLGLAYQSDPKTVWRASYGIMFTHGDAVGGSASSLGTLGFSAAPSFAVGGNLLSTAPFTPTSAAFPAFAGPAGVASGPGYGTGYTTTTAGYTGTPTAMGYDDPYLGSRAPEFINWTFGMQHQWTQSFVTTVTYVGSQGHFLPSDGSNARGYYADQLDPKYLTLGTNLAALATTTACTTAGVSCPAGFLTTQTIANALKPFPFQGVTDTFGYVANSNYNGLQVTANMRPTRGLTFMANYTWARSIDDGGTYRTGYAIPAGTIAGEPGVSHTQDRIERSASTSNQPHHVVVTAVWDLPFGKYIANGHAWERNAFGGFKFSEIFQAFSGSPLPITASTCQTNPAQITCNVNYNPAFTGTAHVGGQWGKHTVSGNVTGTSYIAPSAGSTTIAATGPFIAPAPPACTGGFVTNGGALNGTACTTTAPITPVLGATLLNTSVAPAYTFANGARTAPLGLTGPGNYQLDLALVRTFPLHYKNTSLNFRAEWYNVTNKTFFSVASSQLGNASFGTVAPSTAYNRKSAQLSMRLNF